MKKLAVIYKKLYSFFGPQHWWPADTLFEVICGAILTRNTSWLNVQRSIDNLKSQKLLDPKKLYCLRQKTLGRLIHSSGYYNVKARRLKEFLKFFLERYQGSLKKMSLASTAKLRVELLSLNGIGPETADSILLYALKKPVFVVDAYTKRILSRHGLLKEDSPYDAFQALFTDNLRNDVNLFNEYHALLVRLAKEFCLKSKPLCQSCPLKNL